MFCRTYFLVIVLCVVGFKIILASIMKLWNIRLEILHGLTLNCKSWVKQISKPFNGYLHWFASMHRITNNNFGSTNNCCSEVVTHCNLWVLTNARSETSLVGMLFIVRCSLFVVHCSLFLPTLSNALVAEWGQSRLMKCEVKAFV